MLEFLELEEQAGHLWHRLVGDAASYPRHPAAAVELNSVRGALGVFFRGMGGAPELEIAAGTPRTSGHRLRLRQRLGLDRERLETPECNAERLLLPTRIDCFPASVLNRRLYFWLAGFFATFAMIDGDPTPRPADPLQADLAFLQRAWQVSRRVCEIWPGLKNTYRELCEGLRAIRPRRRLPPQEQAVEALIMALLGDESAQVTAATFFAAITEGRFDLSGIKARRGYRPFLPVPLWGEVTGVAPQRRTAEHEEEPEENAGSQQVDGRKRRAQRRQYDQAERDDPLLLNRFEKFLSWSEMVNVNRAVDDEDEETARKAADDMDELALSRHQRRAATRLKFDLDLAPDEAPAEALQAPLTYPEWNYRRRIYHPDYCVVSAQPAPDTGDLWEPDAAARRRIRGVRRQFEALRPKREILRRQLDGVELDMDALVRTRCDLAANGIGSDRVYLSARNQARDLAVAILVDVSLSTDSWIDNRRVLDVEKEALTALAFGLAACGDDFAVFTFSSRKRKYVRVDSVKRFDERLDERVLRRISALRPGYYTRMGAALRHVQRQLAERPQRHRLLLILTDGKPNDLDHYEGRYGVEDTRKAIQEARREGSAVFGITIDHEAQDYFPYIFGRGAYSIVSRIDRLPQALPIIYRQLVN